MLVGSANWSLQVVFAWLNRQNLCSGQQRAATLVKSKTTRLIYTFEVNCVYLKCLWVMTCCAAQEHTVFPVFQLLESIRWTENVIFHHPTHLRDLTVWQRLDSSQRRQAAKSRISSPHPASAGAQPATLRLISQTNSFLQTMTLLFLPFSVFLLTSCPSVVFALLVLSFSLSLSFLSCGLALGSICS